MLSHARLQDGRLKGDVCCGGGGERKLVATVAVKGVLAGTLGGVPLKAELKRDPPAPGALRPRPPPSIAGNYKLSPRSDCFGGAFEIEKAGGAYEIKGGLGRLVYDDGPIAGRVTCRDKSVRAVTGMAVNRDMTLNVPAGGTATAPEKVGATRQREFTKTVAAFFLGDRHARVIEQGGREINVRQHGHDYRAGTDLARVTHQERHAELLLVD